MAQAVVLKCCAEPEHIEYWHDHDSCKDELCYAVECESCHEWITTCGMDSKESK